MLDQLTDAEVLDAVCPPETSAAPAAAPALVGLATQTVEMLLADESLAGELRWVVHGLVPEDAFVVVYGSPKVGKGTLVTNLAKCVIAGEPFAGKEVTSGDVLWLDLEQTRWLTRRKFEEEGAFNQLHQVHIYNGAPPSLALIKATIDTLKPHVVVIDSLSRLLLLDDENSSSEVTAALEPLVRLAHDNHIAIIAIHHARKSGGSDGASMRGSSAFFAVSDVALEVKRYSDDTADARRKLVGVSRYDEGNETIIVRRTDDGYLVEESPSEKRRRELLTHLVAGRTELSELARRFHVRKAIIAADIDILIAKNKLLRLGAGKRNDPYQYHAL